MSVPPILLCIPRIECTISKDYIYKIFSKLRIGKIESLQEIPLHNGSQYKRIILKIIWATNDISLYIQNRLLHEQTVKIVYDMPWYWLCVKYAKHQTKKIPGPDPAMMKMLE